MNISKSSDSEAELLERFHQSPENTMPELMEHYTSLVRSTVERFLDNPEDVNECVNDTFMEFFRAKDQFDREKGNLSSYLTGIAKNLAISRFRKNVARPTSELPDDVIDRRDPIGDTERRADLERAINQLSSDEAELIRMKYYEGKTLQEVADAQGLPHETVKKRHQRSLSKLKILLTTGLVLLLAALLAACAYAVLRHFGLLPGYGMSRDSGGPVYLLAEESSAEGERWTYTAKEVVLLEGTLRIKVSAHLKDADDVQQQWKELRDQCGTAQVEIAKTGERILGSSKISELYGYDADIDLLLKGAEALLEGQESELTLHLYEVELPISLERVELERPEDHSFVLAEEGGILAIPKRQDGVLSVELYPLSTGRYEVSPDLIYGAYRQGKRGDITVTTEDGQTLTGQMVPNRFSERFSVWEFGPAEPGTYTLHIPYLYLLHKTEAEKIRSISIDLENCRWEDKVIELPCGTVSLVSCEKVELDEYPGVPAWRIVMQADTDMELSEPPLRIEIERAQTLGGYRTLPDHQFELVIRFPTEEENDAHPELGPIDLSRAQMTLASTISLFWDQELTIPLTVE